MRRRPFDMPRIDSSSSWLERERFVHQSSQRRAVVTGAASGIGRATAERLIEDGYEVLAVDRDSGGLAPVAELGADVLAADLAAEVDRDAVARAAAGVNHVVQAAGIIRLKRITELTTRDWHDIMAVNAEAVFFLCQTIGPTMPPGGSILNVSSVSAKLATTTEAAIYAASKAAVLSITRSFAYALAPVPVRVNAILPGIIDTPMQDDVLEKVAALRGMSPGELSDLRESSVPLGRSATPAEIAEFIRVLLSDSAGYVTGQAINFDGGFLTW